MNTIAINNIADVVRFFQFLYDEFDLAFHPDDAFIDYVDGHGNLTFTEEEALVLDEKMEECFFLCEKAGLDLYEIGHEIQLREFRKRGILPQAA